MYHNTSSAAICTRARAAAVARVVAVLQRFLMYWTQKKYSTVQYSTVQYSTVHYITLQTTDHIHRLTEWFLYMPCRAILAVNLVSRPW